MVQDIKGYVHDFCRDQHGSRFIQQKLADALPEEIMAVFEEVQPHAISLMQDVFGNYVIQKCFEHGSKVSLALSLMLPCCQPFCQAQRGNSCTVRQLRHPEMLRAWQQGQSCSLSHAHTLLVCAFHKHLRTVDILFRLLVQWSLSAPRP